MAKPYDPKDFYYRQAKKQGLRARSAFKIDEILRRHRLLSKGEAVLDLGAAPGGFLQILADLVGEKGVAVGVDLEPIRNLGKRWVKTDVVDLLAPDAIDRIRALHDGPFDLVTSDMAPKTIGVKLTDEARSLELCRMALSVAERTLRPGGGFVTKVFMGGDFPPFKKELQARFDAVHVARPQATREASYEVYVVGTGFKGRAAREPAPVNVPAPELEPVPRSRERVPSPSPSPSPATPATPRKHPRAGSPTAKASKRPAKKRSTRS